jgi:hypothetical protein
MLQAAAMTLGIALLLWSTGLPTFFRFAEAASITSASDTLSNSAPSAASDHTIVFTTPDGIAANQTIDLTFNQFFDILPILYSDVSIASTTGSGLIQDGSNGAGVWGFSTSTNLIELQAPSDYVAASSTTFTIKIGTNAGGANQISNPATTTSYKIDIGGTMPDSGQARVAIVNQVNVSASVDTSLTFTVSGVANGQTVNSSPTTTATTTTATTLPFGTIAVGVSKVLAQDLSVATNAKNGFVVTVEETQPFQSSTGADIDSFYDGDATTTPQAWRAPAADVTNENTYGHWGLTSDDATTTRSTEFGPDEWVGPSTTPTIVMGNNSSSDGVTDGKGKTRVGYQVQISALQEAGTDYNTKLRYIATPTF